MWSAATGALIAALTASAPAAEPNESAEILLAINPNISIGRCSGGTPIDISFGMPTREQSGQLFGEMAAMEAFGFACTGYFEDSPHFCISVPNPGGYFTFEITDANGVDTTLAVVGDNMDWPFCDDDGAGHDLLSRVTNFFEPGEYLVYVGSFSMGQTANFTITARAGEHW